MCRPHHHIDLQYLPTRAAMETEDTSWFTTMAVFDDHTTPDALLDALLDDVANSHANGMNVLRPQSPLSAEAVHGVETNVTVVSSARQSRAIESVGGETRDRTMPPPPKKRKRIRNYRPKNGIEALRQSVADLESLLALARQCHREGRRPALQAIGHAKEGQYTPQEAMWMGVATRQYKLMRESQVENERLRSQVLSQLQIVKGLTRLVQRAQAGLPSLEIERPLIEEEAQTRAFKRRELVAVLENMYSCTKAAFADDVFKEREFGDVVTTHHEREAIKPGAVLSMCRLRRSTPHSVSALSNCIWNGDPTRAINEGTYKLEHIEKEQSREVLYYTVRFRTPTGTARYRGVAARILIFEEERHVMLMTSSTWPLEITQAPWNAVGVDMKQWSVFQPVPPHAQDAETVSEVLQKMEASKPSNTRSSMTKEEATILQAFVATTARFSLEQYERAIDELLLGQIEVLV